MDCSHDKGCKTNPLEIREDLDEATRATEDDTHDHLSPFTSQSCNCGDRREEGVPPKKVQ
jgi:hypothetical protein